jgi:hypothetical protein
VHLRKSGSILYVEYSTSSEWEIMETHFALGTSLDDIPQTKKGNPKIGRFPFQSEHPEGTDTHTYIINLDQCFPDGWTGKLLYFAAHAVVSHPCKGEETAWADTWGQSFPGSSWALYFTVQA